MSWLKSLGQEATLNILDDLSTAYYFEKSSPGYYQLDQVYFLIKSRAWLDLLNYEVDYQAISIGEAIAVRQMLAFYEKLDCLPTGIDREAKAFEKFVEAEEACKATNDRFRSAGWRNFSPAVVQILFYTMNEISHILGRPPSLASLDYRFGPGATSSIRRNKASIQQKLAEKPSCSETMLHHAYFRSFLREFPHWLDCHAESAFDSEGYEVWRVDVSVETSKLCFVPKNAKTFRSIITQPTLNSLYQLGIGDYMVKRLKRVGVDLGDQSKNQRKARIGSITGDIATVDLQSASDRIATHLVKFLLQDDWYDLLLFGRCPTYTYKGSSPKRLEQFSSMGNGFTFPLETLLFYSLARAVLKYMNASAEEWDMLSVYGDDITLPSRCFSLLTEVFTECGFLVNSKKSFSNGPFRESCGADYLQGIDIRPFYVRSELSGENLFLLYNYFVRLYEDDISEFILRYIPEHMRLYGPDGYGDGHLVCRNYIGYRTRSSIRKGWGGRYFRTYKRLGSDHKSFYPGDFVSPLYMIYVSPASEPLHKNRDGTISTIHRSMRFSKDGRIIFDLPSSRDRYTEVSIYTLS
ncbi:TPA_asm: RNA-directed RNA polymerase [ssRNA phage ESE019]|uniref:RNA-directed RNA polymerase n=1 Tax=ssRNA phage ESE019 TaxID=2786002 RepID=A0A8S5KXN2_9VIRU|nr:RNA-directed RNA polymerase [ssRNA phage ESE019]DAD49900.1 TPA_asm: RNA-directed RNA polymerase [ssRNA phage ESE019]